jgi:hypothetical protein
MAIVTLMALAGIIGTTLLAGARTAATINVTISNNSQRNVRHVYLAAGDPNNWSADQLNGSIMTGSSATLSGVSCDGASIRVIAEDQDGCFFYRTVSCGENATWTITSNAPRDCGS